MAVNLPKGIVSATAFTSVIVTGTMTYIYSYFAFINIPLLVTSELAFGMKVA